MNLIMKLIAKMFGNNKPVPLTINDVVSQFSKMIKDLNDIADKQRASITSCDLNIKALEERKIHDQAELDRATAIAGKINNIIE